MELCYVIIIVIITALCSSLLTGIAGYQIVRNPYEYPHMTIAIDVTGNPDPQIEDEIDRYLYENRIEAFPMHNLDVQEWKRRTEIKIANSWFPNRRMKQYRSVIDDDHMFVFMLTRKQIKRIDDMDIAYTHTMAQKRSFSLNQILERYIAITSEPAREE